MANTDYYGNKHGTTFLEIYSKVENEESRTIHRQLSDQEAYDTWHLSHYFQELLSYRRLLKNNIVSFEEIPRKEKNLLLYLLLCSKQKFSKILEIGSTLFEMIEGLQLIEKYVESNGVKLPVLESISNEYIGIEISELLGFASMELHPQHKIDVYNSVVDSYGNSDIIYDRSVTNYAFQNSQEVAAFVNTSKVALLNIYVSKNETFESSRLGKALTYFSLEELIDGMDLPLYHLFGTKAPGPALGRDTSLGRPVIEGFFLSAEPDTAAEFFEIAHKDPAIKSYFNEKNIKLTAAKDLL
jgi:hypothetical protein